MATSIHAPSRKREEPAKRLYVWRNPGTVIDRNGMPVSTIGEHWRVNNVARAELINWDLIDTAPDIKDTAKAWVVHLIESLAPLTAARCFCEFRHFVVVAKPLQSLDDITYPVLESSCDIALPRINGVYVAAAAAHLQFRLHDLNQAPFLGVHECLIQILRLG